MQRLADIQVTYFPSLGMIEREAPCGNVSADDEQKFCMEVEKQHHNTQRE